MLNRRYLRIKVYQSLYALWQSDRGSAAKVEKELFLSIERTFDLYISLLLLFGELRSVAEQRIEERMNKRLPTDQDLHPNRRFVDGPLLNALAQDPVLAVEAERRKVNWVGHKEMVQRLFRRIAEDPEFESYMKADAATIKDEQRMLLHVFVDIIADQEVLHDHYEARSIYWLEDLDLACGLVKRTIEQLRPPKGLGPLLSEVVGTPEEERQFVSLLFRRSVEQSEEHDALIAAKAKNWESDRIALSDMILMKMALTEAR
ncbi:MAG: hypothetical protein KDB88_09755, partial [Flavobacteriales bacterium]|nr:hypothetical protein [Flavobacteriales bacterium]